MTTAEIRAFIEARIAEDESAARVALAHEKPFTDDGGFDVSYQWVRMTRHRESGGSGAGFVSGAPSPSRVLRECAAKRVLLGLATEIACSAAEFADLDYDTLTRALAAGYADHPDYAAEWKM